jgi:hypothetical protein
MLKTLLAGATLGYLGKKLYDEGKLDPYVEKAKSKLNALSGNSEPVIPPATKKAGKGQPDLAF